MSRRPALRALPRRTLLRLALLSCVPGGAFAQESVGWVQASTGTLPLILTVPHDGDRPIPGVPPRTGGERVRDVGTRALAEGIADALETRLGARPYLLVALFARRYVDANRPLETALETPEAIPAYSAYRDRLAAFVAEVRERFPEGALLVDVHGHGRDPDLVFRGTRSGLTVRRLVERFGPAALQGPNSLTGALAARGYRIDPAQGGTRLDEGPWFVGGHTVSAYGSHRPEGIDAIQLEFGRALRAQSRTASDVADALADFLRTYAGVRR
jgi:N-formylglutamate amidohydrolase